MPSSVVSHIQYNAETATLRIIYVSGSIYDYTKVTESIYQEMKAASSKGIFLNTRIKGAYPFKKIK